MNKLVNETDESCVFMILQDTKPIYECFIDEKQDFKKLILSSLNQIKSDQNQFLNGSEFNIFTRTSNHDNIVFVLATNVELEKENANQLLNELQDHIEMKYHSIIGNEITSKITFQNNQALNENVIGILQKHLVEFMDREMKIDEIRNKYF